jgi:hypothetical protein
MNTNRCTPCRFLEIAAYFDNARFCFRHRALRVNGDADWSSVFAAWTDDTSTFITIGHSTRTIAEFVDLVRESGRPPDLKLN